MTEGPPRLRALPTPACDPPYETAPAEQDGRAARWSGPTTEAIQGALALDPPEPALPPRSGPTLQVVRGGRDGQRARRSPHEERVHRFAQAVAEVLAGGRPLQQLAGVASARVYTRVSRMTADPARRTRFRPTVRGVRACEPADGVIEASATVQFRDRTRAMALRLERAGDTWVCTAFETR